jgi:coproporphyrinogen III oxidase
MKSKSKNIKISEKHHEILKSYCDKNGLKMYRVVEKWIDEINKSKINKKDIYGET